MFKKISILLIALSLTLAPTDGWARGGGSSGSSSSSSKSPSRSSSPSRSWGSSSRSAAPKPAAPSRKPSWGTSTKPAPKPVAPAPAKPSWGSSTKAPAPKGTPNAVTSSSRGINTPAKKSIVDQAAAKTVKTIPVFKSKTEAQTALKKEATTKYTSAFKTEPTVRPNYIPSTTVIAGRNYNVIYDTRYGGYGYYDPLGHWMAYSILSDAIMMDSVLNRDYVNRTTVVYSNGGSAFGFIFTLLLVGGVIVVAVIFLKRGR